ncbi:miniconductance mechanosensitive channel [Natranaerovirga hydrolytica]|uniref:Miniconductance mechanosensitive channel n=2 Tax=Natranaerovirga hydrolytica TaxID=680378 RepID=A0A4R1MZ55_9FIRM|nr:miniconductance mechanosensitive channel [Natranaerovirga hydrolytica]
MYKLVQRWIGTKVDGTWEVVLSYVIVLASILLITYIVNFIVKKIILNIIHNMVKKTHNNWDETVYDNKVFHYLAHIPAAIVLFNLASLLGDFETFVQKLIFAFIIIMIILASLKFLNAVVEIYNGYEFAKDRPIKGIIDVIKIFFYVFAGIILFSMFTENSPIALLSALGGISAILLLIFNDSILGLVASIQLTANESLKIGDWIEMPSQNADGEVIDIRLNKIKVQNWDRTISNIPAQNFLRDSFKNWEGMTRSGGRRIMRSILIDINSIKILDEPDIKKFEEIHYIKDYIKNKKEEIKTYNEEKVMNNNEINGRRLTNIGTFRAYIKEYIKSHPNIKNDFIMVRQLAPTDKGVPLEVYAFTNNPNWVAYEEIQSDIFDHLLAVIHLFDIKVYQAPTGNDITDLKSQIKS